jgi:hypothetical protein
MEETRRKGRIEDREKKEKTKTVLEVVNVKEGGNKVRNFHSLSVP